MFHEEVAFFKYAIRSALSFCFLIPAKIIFVPGMYFLGFSKYSISVLSFQVTPEKQTKKTTVNCKASPTSYVYNNYQGSQV